MNASEQLAFEQARRVVPDIPEDADLASALLVVANGLKAERESRERERQYMRETLLHVEAICEAFREGVENFDYTVVDRSYVRVARKGHVHVERNETQDS